MSNTTMGLRRRVHQVSSTPAAEASSSSSSSSSLNSILSNSKKRTHSDNNNSPWQGNLNPIGQPTSKKTRSNSQHLSKAKEFDMAKKVVPPLWNDPRPYASIAGLSIEAQKALCAEGALPSPISYMSATMASFVGSAAAQLEQQSKRCSGSGSNVDPTISSYIDLSNMTMRLSSGWSDGESSNSQGLLKVVVTPSVGIVAVNSPSITNGSNSNNNVSITNTRTTTTTTITSSTSTTSNTNSISTTSTTSAISTAVSFRASTSFPAKSVTTANTRTSTNAKNIENSSCMASSSSPSSTTLTEIIPSNLPSSSIGEKRQPGTSTNFTDYTMFETYQPWVIKTYGDLSKTKTITIKKYERILRTLRGKEVNSAENSKFRFWVKSKGFQIGQPVGYDAKPADKIAGRHTVNNPGLDPSLYVPTQPVHNKSLDGIEGTVPQGRVYKKVAIVENFFDIIHAVHVDLEGRPGKHAGQKRTYRTITETYAFLPREAVTRFLLGCTECQRRPRTPSPTSIQNLTLSTPSTTIRAATVIPFETVTTNTAVENADSPKPAVALLSVGEISDKPLVSNFSIEKITCPKEASHPLESMPSTTIPLEASPQEEQQQQTMDSAMTQSTILKNNVTNSKEKSMISCNLISAVSIKSGNINNNDCDIEIEGAGHCSSNNRNVTSSNVTCNLTLNKHKDVKYNPLSISNLLRKDPISMQRATIPLINTPSSHISRSTEVYQEPSHMTTSRIMPVLLNDRKNSSKNIEVSNSAEKDHKLKTIPEDQLLRTTTATSSLSFSASVPVSSNSIISNSSRPSNVNSNMTSIIFNPRVSPETSTPAINYERLLCTAYLTQQLYPNLHSAERHSSLNIIKAIKRESEALQAMTAMAAASYLSQKKHSFEIMSSCKNLCNEKNGEPEPENDSFSSAAGLIETNLNLLTTIQQLHCQVMLALTHRLRPISNDLANTNYYHYHNNLDYYHQRNIGPPAADES